MKNTLLASAATPFAHLLGRRMAAATPGAAAPQAGKPKAEDDDDDDMTDEEKRKKRNRDAGRDEDDDGDDGADGKKGKKAKAAKADDEDDDDEKAKAATLKERARCAAIFADPAAGKRPDMAAHLAFETDLPKAQAVAMLRAISAGEPAPVAATAPDKPSARTRMEQVPNPDVGGNEGAQPAEKDPSDKAADFIMASAAKARGTAASQGAR